MIDATDYDMRNRCARRHVQSWHPEWVWSKQISNSKVIMHGDFGIQAVTETDFHKYLGIFHAGVGNMDIFLLPEFLRSVKHKCIECISALNVFVIPSLAYSVVMFPWMKADLENVQWEIGNTMSKFRMNHQHADAERTNY